MKGKKEEENRGSVPASPFFHFSFYHLFIAPVTLISIDSSCTCNALQTLMNNKKKSKLKMLIFVFRTECFEIIIGIFTYIAQWPHILRIV